MQWEKKKKKKKVALIHLKSDAHALYVRDGQNYSGANQATDCWIQDYCGAQVPNKAKK